MLTLFATIYVVCGKVNFANISRYSDLSERTYRRHFEEPYKFMGLNRETIRLAITPTHFQVGAIDASFLPKSGKATYGVDYFHNGKAGRSERGLELSMIAMVDVETSIAYSLSAQLDHHFTAALNHVEDWRFLFFERTPTPNPFELAAVPFAPFFFNLLRLSFMPRSDVDLIELYRTDSCTSGRLSATAWHSSLVI